MKSILTSMTVLAGAALVLAAAHGRAADRDVLYEADFESYDSAWRTGMMGAGSMAEIAEGALKIHAMSGDGSIFARLDREFDDVVVEVDTTLVDGSPDNWQTITCRRSADGLNYYNLGVSADGFYAIDVWINGVRAEQSVGPAPSEAIAQGVGAMNHIKAECVGDLIRLTVNDEPIGELRDATHAAGQIEVSVDSLGGPFSEVSFDNLVVSKP